jgi:hypothetical protein
MRKMMLASFIAIAFASCCKAICEDQGLHIRIQNMQAVDTDTVYLIKYKAYSRFSERIDTVKRFSPVPVGSNLPSTFFDVLDYSYDWKVVIPATNKEYFIQSILTGKKPCQCEGGSYRSVERYELNDIEVEGNSAVLN